MKINLELAEKILKAMFIDWDFNFNINLIDSNSFEFSIENNEMQYIFTKIANENSNRIDVWIITQNEDEKLLGYYYVKNESPKNRSFEYKKGQFAQSSDFYEIMFLQHLTF